MSLLERFTPQLILPDAMKVFPVYMNSLLKTPALVGSTELSTDDRAFHRFLVNSMGVEETQVLLYPRLIPLVSYTLTQHLYFFVSLTSNPELQSLCVYIMFMLFLSALYGCVQRGDPSSSALLWGEAQWVWHVSVGKRVLDVPLAGTGLSTRPHPEPLQCALSRPPVLRRGMTYCFCNYIFIIQ